MPRLRLVSMLTESRLGIVEAAGGYGKSVLIAQFGGRLGHAAATAVLEPGGSDASALAAAIRRALRLARLSDLVPALDAPDPGAGIDALLESLATAEQPVLLAIDDTHHLEEPAGQDLLLRLSRNLPAPHRLLVAARWLPAELSTLRRAPTATTLGTEELRFTEGETKELLAPLGIDLPEHAVRGLLRATGGWAAALTLAAAAVARAADPLDAVARLAADEAVPSALVEEALGRLTPPERACVVQLAHLPLLSPEVAAAVGDQSDLFDRMAAAGLPLARTAAGWWELPGPVTEHLRGRGALEVPAAAAAAVIYAAAGERATALRTLLAGSALDGAARLLESLDPEQVEALGCDEVAGVVDSLDDGTIASHPRVLLHLARAAEATYRSDLRRTALDRAAALGERGSTAFGRELEAERGRDLLWDEHTRAEAAELATAVLERTGPNEEVARARALDVLGRAHCWLAGDGRREEAEPLLVESIRLSRRIGARTWAAQAVVPLAWGVHFAQCRYDRSLATLDEALADLPARSRYRPVLLSFRADVLTELGRPLEAEATVEEMRELGRLLGEAWALAFASWAEARIASYAGDATRTRHAVLEVERHRGTWYERVAGLEFLTHAADLLDRAGEHALAQDYLDRARARADDYDRPLQLFSATVAGRSGPPEQAQELIGGMLDRLDLEPQEQWHLELLRAYAALRAGDERAGELAAAAFDTCLAVGSPEGPAIREPAVTDQLLRLAAAAGSASAADLVAAGSRLSLNLLGGFELRQSGRSLDLPAGKPVLAVRAVATLGGRVHAEELAELLWPEVDPDTQRNRLRNLLSRARSPAGPLLLRDENDLILPAGTVVDATQFETEAREALALASSGEGTRAAVLARSALGRYRGDLLPGDRYEPWAAARREQLRMLHLELLDLVAEDAEQREEVDEAVRMLQRALDVEPHDEVRYVRLAGLLASQGRVGSAHATLRRAHAALAGLGLEPSASLLELERAIGGPAV